MACRRPTQVWIMVMARRWMMSAAPNKRNGPLMTRRADRKLPDLTQIRPPTWRRTLPLFILTMTVSALAIFNYQKTTSPVVSAALYALRTSPRARALLGHDIYFRRAVPWIRGELNTRIGSIDIRFAVKGHRNHGLVRFAAHRPPGRLASSPLVTDLWLLTVVAESGQEVTVDLLAEGAGHPLGHLLAGDEPGLVGEGVEAEETRGFRQQSRLGR
ncbi:hypothetical protein XA68_15533 [Ophiocordyceps unilateralis]|uniref:DUF1783-domain-containing protein n=1 Tax=Ophiocordyceps unilateralis TaxID=268505 RepID=A0A2A9PLR8_OPHUN|nr:hypothetical protein XA68_15533 [Ophiocordyceps unilateralis]